jgi:hypothetical protein
MESPVLAGLPACLLPCVCVLCVRPGPAGTQNACHVFVCCACDLSRQGLRMPAMCLCAVRATWAGRDSECSGR